MSENIGAYAEAKAAIQADTAKASALWILISEEHQRDGYALRPMPWEGPGEYQRVTFDDGRDGLVRLHDLQSLPVAKATGAKP